MRGLHPSISPRAWRSVCSALTALVFFCVNLANADSPARDEVPLRELISGVWIAGQIDPLDLPGLKARGFHAVVDLRPDGEEAGQPNASVIEAAARSNGLAFDYVPVAGGATADQVAALAASLSAMQGPVVLYCRSGRRAARTWALSEASRVDGLDAAQINAALVSSGQAAADLDPEIRRRIAARLTSQ